VWIALTASLVVAVGGFIAFLLRCSNTSGSGGAENSAHQWIAVGAAFLGGGAVMTTMFGPWMVLLSGIGVAFMAMGAHARRGTSR
jgi:hypothetical protein